ncbi:MAG: hypothetical protein IPL61_32245 [Myxococcales bacterium]|nr:hypothetical protein [Myxococcales bacterium]
MLTLMIEAIDVTITSTSATVHVVDATATRSGWEQRTATTRVGAIRAALLSLLENSVTGYGRGYCTILVPTSGRSGLDAHERATFRVDLDTASLMTELIEGSALVVSILALLAAPFTGGASLALLIPLGVIGAIPSAYRLVKRNEEGTFAWDMETALDIVNIASSVLGVSQTGAGALKLTRLAKVVQFAGHGADGLGLVLGTSQFFDELEAIARDESLLPNQRRLAMTMAVANKLVNDGVMVGHALAMRAYGQMVHEGLDPRRYPLGPEVLPASTELPPVRARSIPAELKPASAEVHAQARAGAGRDVLVLVDPALAGMTAEVRYVLDAYGFIAEVYIALGPRAGAAQLPAHAATARQLFKFTGVLGKARTLLDWARAFFARDPSLKVGKTRAWEARVELEKLPKQLADYMRGVHAGLADGSLTPAAIDAYVRGLFDQLAEHEAALRDAATPRGRIAADDRSAPPPSARQQLLAAARAQALAILGLDPAALVVREAPGRGEVRAGVDDDGRIALTVPEHFTDGSPIDAVDLGYALEDHRDRAERRPADVTRPDPAKPWDADREAAYRGRAKAEPGYRWELAPDGTLRYVGHPPRLWSPAHGRFARDPAAPSPHVGPAPPTPHRSTATRSSPTSTRAPTPMRRSRDGRSMTSAHGRAAAQRMSPPPSKTACARQQSTTASPPPPPSCHSTCTSSTRGSRPRCPPSRRWPRGCPRPRSSSRSDRCASSASSPGRCAACACTRSRTSRPSCRSIARSERSAPASRIP